MEKEFYKQNTLTDYPAPQVASTALPRQIGPYKIESLLSKGGMSILYLGLHPQTRELLAIKVLSPQFVNHPEMTEQFLKEAKIIGLTSHPNIVKLYGQGSWEGGLYIAMEFIRGVSLKQFIVQQSLSLKRSTDILLQVSYALYHLHSHNVIHGDLKPENILITEDGEVKVIDFGIARLHEERPSSKKGMVARAGTPNYMSPEQKEKQSPISFASDIYSLGIIAYELILGKLSFGVIHPSLLPKGIRKIIEKAIAVSVAERYQKILDFINDLSHYLKSGEIERDRPGADQLKEVVESLQQTAQSLSPAILPSFPQLELGLVKYKAPLKMGSYFDFFRFSGNTYGFLIAEAPLQTLDAAIYIANLRGMIRTFISDQEGKPIKPSEIAGKLSQLCRRDYLAQPYAFSYLLLNPLQDLLSYISCGLGGLIHLPQGREAPRLLVSQNPLLGKEMNPEFLEISDNWDVGDSLTFHSFDSALNSALMDALVENSLLSAQGQAEAIVKKASVHPQFTAPLNPKILLTIHRTG